jgi:hypothetical protein
MASRFMVLSHQVRGRGRSRLDPSRKIGFTGADRRGNSRAVRARVPEDFYAGHNASEINDLTNIIPRSISGRP